nr:proline-rich protein 2-like [Equus asinus]
MAQLWEHPGPDPEWRTGSSEHSTRRGRPRTGANPETEPAAGGEVRAPRPGGPFCTGEAAAREGGARRERRGEQGPGRAATYRRAAASSALRRPPQALPGALASLPLPPRPPPPRTRHRFPAATPPRRRPRPQVEAPPPLTGAADRARPRTTAGRKQFPAVALPLPRWRTGHRPPGPSLL